MARNLAVYGLELLPVAVAQFSLVQKAGIGILGVQLPVRLLDLIDFLYAAFSVRQVRTPYAFLIWMAMYGLPGSSTTKRPLNTPRESMVISQVSSTVTS